VIGYIDVFGQVDVAIAVERKEANEGYVTPADIAQTSKARGVDDRIGRTNSGTQFALYGIKP